MWRRFRIIPDKQIQKNRKLRTMREKVRSFIFEGPDFFAKRDPFLTKGIPSGSVIWHNKEKMNGKEIQ